MTSKRSSTFLLLSTVNVLLIHLSTACDENPSDSNFNFYASTTQTKGSFCYSILSTASCNTSSACCGSSTAKSVIIYYREACMANITAITVNKAKWKSFAIGKVKGVPAVVINKLPTKMGTQQVCLSIKTAAVACSTAAHFSGGASVMSSKVDCCPWIKFNSTTAPPSPKAKIPSPYFSPPHPFHEPFHSTYPGSPTPPNISQPPIVIIAKSPPFPYKVNPPLPPPLPVAQQIPPTAQDQNANPPSPPPRPPLLHGLPPPPPPYIAPPSPPPSPPAPPSPHPPHPPTPSPPHFPPFIPHIPSQPPTPPSP
ncbi:hypothetical protein CEUSTIGMA_g1205.t1, partial [Chlamydomonas eustigma]